MKFSIWLENKNIQDSIVGTISPEADVDEQEDILNKKTTFYGSEIRKKLKNLGIVKNSNIEILRSIDDGIKISDLIDRLKN